VPAAGGDDVCGEGAVAVDELESLEGEEADDEPTLLDELDVVAGGCGATEVAAPTLEIAMKFPPNFGFERVAAEA
jgi:hypothetical protein